MQNHVYTSNISKRKPQILVAKQRKGQTEGVRLMIKFFTAHQTTLTRDQGNQITLLPKKAEACYFVCEPQMRNAKSLSAKKRCCYSFGLCRT